MRVSVKCTANERVFVFLTRARTYDDGPWWPDALSEMAAEKGTTLLTTFRKICARSAVLAAIPRCIMCLPRGGLFSIGYCTTAPHCCILQCSNERNVSHGNEATRLERCTEPHPIAIGWRPLRSSCHLGQLP